MGTEKTQTQRNYLVDLLFILFGVSSWVAVNGLWVELPVLVNQLPEGWQLGSYIVITTQVANLGPIIFSTARRIWSLKVLETPLIHASLATVIAACALLSIFWDRTSFIGQQQHSTALLALTFFMAFVDCTSSLLFLPFVANFKERYVISYLVGAGLSGPLPSILALAQGVGGYPECRNETVSSTGSGSNGTGEYKMERYYQPPRFAPSVFFAVLSGQMLVSWVAFVLLSRSKLASRERATLMPVTHPPNPAMEHSFMSSTQKELSASLEKTTSSQIYHLKCTLSLTQYVTLLFIQGYLCMVHNGVLLSIQTYSCLPYGSLAYHLTVTLSSFANPICCFVAMFLAFTNVSAVVALAVFVSGWAGYILATAALSPSPPLVHSPAGPYLIVFSWVMVSGMVAYLKACIANILRREGGQIALYRCGIVTQIGSAIGAVISFTLINATTIFNSYDPCGS